jgi:glycogen debranching enzyme
MAIEDTRESLVIREQGMFLLTDTTGRVPRGNENGFGLYYADTRYLSTYELSFSTSRALALLSKAELGYSSEHVLTNFTMEDASGRTVPRGTIEVHRTRVIEDVLEETLEVRNFNSFSVHLDLTFRFAADFADIFVIRGFEPEQKGELEPPHWRPGSLTFVYKGLDGHRRQTMITFDPHPSLTTSDRDTALASFHLELAPGERSILRIVFSVEGRLGAPEDAARFEVMQKRYAQWMQEATGLRTDNDFFDAVLRRSLNDLRMLWQHERNGGYPAAGTPWYDALFGRDTAITGLQTIWLKPQLAKQCLAALARYQGTKFDSWRDEEPGKILHELRVGELTRTGDLPFSPYFGSIDSTPLFLLLAGEYFQWTADIEMIRSLEINLRAALHWIEKYGGQDGDGYVEYEKRSERGLANQGWKDSDDAMVHADGSLMSPPIALVEVQAYVYAAYRKMGRVFRALGDEETAQRLSSRAAGLKERFRRDFWVEEGYFGLALDGQNRLSSSVASNAGHALWAGIADQEQADKQVRRLMQEDIFSGWGIRTISEDSPRYNPQGYHLGTVWPHDNSIAAMGFKRYGHETELNQLTTALFEAAKAFEYYRLPELFGGNRRSAHHSPVPYPVACRPQAWAAGAFPVITQAILGLCPDAPNNRLCIVRPQLPQMLHAVAVNGLRVGRGEADVFFERRSSDTHVEVVSTRGSLAVQIVERWPGDL